MPRNNHLGISQRLEDEEERERLLELLQEVLRQENWSGPGVYCPHCCGRG